MFQSDTRSCKIVGDKWVYKCIDRSFNKKMRRLPHEFVTLGRDTKKDIMKEINNDICDKICQIYK